jgi:replicative DNA helicase
MIQPELALLPILLNYVMYTKYRPFITIKEQRDLQNLYHLLDELMGRYQRDLSLDEYSLFVLSNSKDVDVATKLLSVIKEANVQPDVAEQLLLQYKERELAHTAALLAIDVTEGKQSFAALVELLSRHESIQEEMQEHQFIEDDLEKLHADHIQKHGLRWRLNSLNKILGSLRKGDFGFIFARPESGKTTFLASEITFFAEQLSEDEGPIIWFNNEEDGKKVQIRCYQASLGVTLEELFRDKSAANERYHSLTRGKIKIFDSASISKNQVERLCKDLNPSAIVFDQLDKIKGFTGDREDLRLGSIYQWAREIAKSYCPVIAVTQSDGSGEGKKWLTMENVANAKTAKQAEADWILGIGATHQDGFEYVRHLHASKNKLTGDEDTDPTQRHGKVDVIIEPQTARYSDFT